LLADGRDAVLEEDEGGELLDAVGGGHLECVGPIL
jgi:hypothetical protein